MSALPGAETVTVAIVLAQMLCWKCVSSCLHSVKVKAGIVERLRAESGVLRVERVNAQVRGLALWPYGVWPAGCWPFLCEWKLSIPYSLSPIRIFNPF